MNINELFEAYKANNQVVSSFEIDFVKTVLPLVATLNLDSISSQYPFHDMEKKQRYCDFVIRENDDVRIAIEIDGYDKRGTGEGMSKSEFVDWQRRQAALTSQGWRVLRFANTDVRDYPQRCAEHISLLLKLSRSKSSHKELSATEKNRLDELTKAQEALTKAQGEAIKVLIKDTSDIQKSIEILKKDASERNKPIVIRTEGTDGTKYNVPSFAALIFALVIVIVWLSGAFSPSQQPSPSPAPPSVVQAPAGATCGNPLPWQQARANIGRTVAVVGPLMNVTTPTPGTFNGDPTWIAVGGVYPSTERLSVVIWGDNKNEFPGVSSRLAGLSVCIIGLIEIFRGTPQIEMRTASQFYVM